jgi:hypothetical protein
MVLVREHAALDVSQASGGRFPADVTCALERWPELRAWARQADWSAAGPLDEAALGPPVPPGDLIFTGTPAGVGNRRNPPRYLAEGDVLVSRFEGIGEIRQSFTRLPLPAPGLSGLRHALRRGPGARLVDWTDSGTTHRRGGTRRALLPPGVKLA